jgi:hypothetical protein
VPRPDDRVERPLSAHLPLVDAPPAGERRPQALPRDGEPVGGDVEQIEQSGEDVEVLSPGREPRRRHAGRAQQERHADRTVEDGAAVHDVTMVEELLAMVGGDDHDRLLEQTAVTERVEEEREL